MDLQIHIIVISPLPRAPDHPPNSPRTRKTYDEDSPPYFSTGGEIDSFQLFFFGFAGGFWIVGHLDKLPVEDEGKGAADGGHDA